MAVVDPPYLVALNLTRRCNLRCEHCYLDAGTRLDGGSEELSTAEVKDIIDQIAVLSSGCMLVMTGGEPLLRPDIEELVAHAANKDLMVVLGTNGMGLTAERIARLQAAGLAGAGISLDSLEPGFHDDFRGSSGAWEKTMNALDACRAAGLVFQLHYSVTDDNAHEFESMVEFAKSAGALALNVFFLVCTGRGERVTNISAGTYEDVLRRVTKAAHDEPSMMIRAKCAPHFKRMALELDPDWPITLAQGYEAGGCLAGTRYCRITPEGGVTACPYLEAEVGSVRETGFDEIWQTAEQFILLREPVLEGRCGACEYTKMCGGCRARPFARDGNLMGEDFLCDYTPGQGAVIQPQRDTESCLVWSEEAETHLARVPPFVRRMVRQGVENFVREQGRDHIEADDMAAAARKRFGEGGMSARFGVGFKRPGSPHVGDGS